MRKQIGSFFGPTCGGANVETFQNPKKNQEVSNNENVAAGTKVQKSNLSLLAFNRLLNPRFILQLLG